MPHVPELIANLASALHRNRWDGASINGAKPVPLSEDVKVGFESNQFWIRFKFPEKGADVEVEARLGMDGAETILKNGEALPNGRIAGKPLAIVTKSLPPRGRGKVALILKYGNAGENSYRFDVTLAST